MVIARRPDWPQVLSRYLEESRAKPFAWGEHDCALFVARWVDRVTGSDIERKFRDVYRSAEGAAEIIDHYGGLSGIATHYLGEPVEINFARRGDVALFDGRHGDTLGLVIGLEVVAPGAAGWVARPVFGCRSAWRVG